MDLAGFTVMTRASRVALESWPRARGLACLLAWCPWFGMSFSLVFTTTGFFTVMTRVALESWPRARGYRVTARIPEDNPQRSDTANSCLGS